jgi:acetyl-CoA acetyltransferase/uncharacterized OB-fold protein
MDSIALVMARMMVTPNLFVPNGDEARLLGSRCCACGRYAFPAQTVCPYCAAADCTMEELSALGRLELCTMVVSRPPGYAGPLPFGFGVVELPEGVRVITRIRDAARLRPGDAVQCVVDTLRNEGGEELLTYAFSPAESPLMSPSVRPLPVPHRPLRPRRASNSRPVYISGVGMHPFGRFEDKSLTDLGVHAVLAALAEAGPGFEAAYCGTVYGGVAAGHKVLTAIGRTGMPILNVEAGCASGGAALGLAASAIASGQYDRVLVLGMEKMPRGIIRSSFFEPWREQAGLAVTPAYFALRALRLMRDSGVAVEHLAQVSVKNHAHGAHNPYAMYRKPLTVDAVLGSPLVCEPLRLLMMCSPNEGAAAVVLSAQKPAEPAVRVLAATLRSHLPGNVLGEHTPLSGLAEEEIASPTELAAQEAYERAGIGPQELDVIELQDTDSARELLSYEELGLCARGACAQWLADGHSAMTGGQPVNPSGGLLSKGEPLGASGLAQVVELCWQLRGTCGARQVPEARLALAHTVGRGANASVVILGR